MTSGGAAPAVLVVGASGELGSSVARHLVARGIPVRGLVRPRAHFRHLRAAGIDLAMGDLRARASLDAACSGVSTVIATANSALPRDECRGTEVEDQGYRNLIQACLRQGVERFVFVSLPETPGDAKVPQLRYKRLVEGRLAASGMSHLIVRPAPFMGFWLPLLGTDLPLRGVAAPSLTRPVRGAGRLRRAAAGTVAPWVPGPPTRRHAMVALDDVAEALAATVAGGSCPEGTVELRGVESPSWADLAEAVGAAEGRSISPRYMPAWVLRWMQLAAKPWGGPGSGIAGWLWAMASFDTPPVTSATLPSMPWKPRTVERFLHDKAAVPAGS